MFEILKQYEKIKKRTIVLEDLRKMVGSTEIDSKGNITKYDYDEYSNFKKKVILVAQKELKQKTDIYFEFKEIKQGRKVVAIEFYIFENTKNKKKIQNTIDFEQISLDIMELQKEFKNKTNLDINYEILNDLIKEKGFNTVKKYIDNWDKFKHLSKKNVLGFFIVAVQKEYDIPTEEKEHNFEFEKNNDFDWEKMYDN